LAVFFDTGVLYSLHDKADSRHLDAAAISFHALTGKWGSPYTSNYVTVETTLLLKSRLGPGPARLFPGHARRMGLKELVVDEESHRKALEIFEKGSRDLSLTDAATHILVDSLEIGTLASFDRRSFGPIKGTIVGAGYASSLTDAESDRLAELEAGTSRSSSSGSEGHRHG